MTDAATHLGPDAAAEAAASADLGSLGAEIAWTSSEAAIAVRDAFPAGYGRLGELAEWLAATRDGAVRPLGRVRLLLAGDATPQVAEMAHRSGLGVRQLAPEPGADVLGAIRLGVAVADDEVDSGAELLVVACPAAPPDAPVAARAAAAALAGALSGAEPVALLPRGRDALDTRDWIARAEYLRDSRRRLMAARGRPDALLGDIGDHALAMLAGLVLRATARRTPLVLDGAAALAAALLCRDIQPRAVRWWRAADTSPDPVHRRCCDELGLTPVLGLGTSAGHGLGGVLCLPLLHAAAELSGRR
ncbi:MAG TPA: nicotinate-nucleotide--dimethylbenzimidazole phosphoribosyltransferase [Jatrophihabitans sp.]|nr:nicotinate-nucleotide--dimethylbenzimidazole phosphoribosyltransferase [Jatrophihabitans sp.]